MADESKKGFKASEVSNEMVALYLLASIAKNENDGNVAIIQGIPVISGKSKEWLLKNYTDCLLTVVYRSPHMN